MEEFPLLPYIRPQTQYPEKIIVEVRANFEAKRKLAEAAKKKKVVGSPGQVPGLSSRERK
jgi:hypothetical protein